MTSDDPGPRHYLYPITETSEYSIGSDHGTDIPTFLKSARHGEVATWRLATNFRQINEGDFLWVYLARPYGTAIKVVGRIEREPFCHPEWNEWACKIKWDGHLSSNLIDHPIPYSVFKQRVWAAATGANSDTSAILDKWLDGVRPAEARPIDREVQLKRREVKVRQGQRAFRQNLFATQGGRCAVTGCGQDDVLQAAHVKAVSKGGRHSTTNGLLLRADIHNLFDSGKLIIDDSFTVRVKQDVTDPEYRRLDGVHLDHLEDLSQQGVGPSKDTLQQHSHSFGWE